MFLHIDIDSFFISAERIFNPKLRNTPAAVGSRSNLEIFNKQRSNIKLLNINSGAFVTPVFHSNSQKTFENYFIDQIGNKKKIRGIITTASYEARECGVKTAMPIAQALKLCPNLIVVPSNMHRYHKLSRDFGVLLNREIPSIEQYSIDEFFGQLDGWVEDSRAEEFIVSLKEKILNELGLPVSIGAAKSKYIAKLATEFAKPYGVFVVQNQKQFIKDIPIDKFPGIGKSFSQKLNSYGIKTLGDICKSKELLYRWKLPGIELYNKICQDNFGEIKQKEPKKSIGLSRTFDTIYDYNEIKRRVSIMARHIAYMVHKAKVNPQRFELKIYYNDGSKIKDGARSNRNFSEHLFKETLLDILQKNWQEYKGVIKIRVSAYAFSDTKKTSSLLDYQEDTKQQNLDSAITKLRNEFGLDILKSGNEI